MQSLAIRRGHDEASIFPPSFGNIIGLVDCSGAVAPYCDVRACIVYPSIVVNGGLNGPRIPSVRTFDDLNDEWVEGCQSCIAWW